MIKKIKHRIRQMIWQKDMRINNGCIIDKKAYVDCSCNLEGNNRFCRDTIVFNCQIGKGTYFNVETELFNAIVGRYCSIGKNVKTIGGRHPTEDFVSTHPAFFSTAKQAGFTYVKENKYDEYLYVKNHYTVEIGNDVWIGSESRIMGGIRIGDGAIIAAGAVVTKDVPPYAIVGGVPARIIRYRFTDTQIEALIKFKWWDKSDVWIQSHADVFENIESFINLAEREI